MVVLVIFFVKIARDALGHFPERAQLRLGLMGGPVGAPIGQSREEASVVGVRMVLRPLSRATVVRVQTASWPPNPATETDQSAEMAEGSEKVWQATTWEVSETSYQRGSSGPLLLGVEW